ncbi:ferredoxin [Vagococcus intermedius]|uniref:Ferredoxin n=1 Tax=Vagococcus intermedius TaxID=2991418 RepID=A0AAF0CWQ1_9ENTE|nr:ferredoxin [Vagococcus intermedius]WEG74262.1 ferredoxin [Vagococcus intermedius]WEG76344.1 ferredoxin [Vagococcus intermedius]
MNVTLIPEKCIACGLCQVLAPNKFDYTAEGIVIFLDHPEKTTQIISENTDDVLKAYKACPTHAITIKKEHD